jgi:hypothetical protein
MQTCSQRANNSISMPDVRALFSVVNWRNACYNGVQNILSSIKNCKALAIRKYRSYMLFCTGSKLGFMLKEEY